MQVLPVKTMVCALVCIATFIGLYLRLYWYVFDCVGLVVLVNVLASVLARARIEKQRHALKKQKHVFGLYLHVSLFHRYQIPTQYMPIHAGMYCNTCQYVYNVFGMYCGMYCDMY